MRFDDLRVGDIVRSDAGFIGQIEAIDWQRIRSDQVTVDLRSSAGESKTIEARSLRKIRSTRKFC